MILCLSKALSASIQSPLLSAFIINGPQQAEDTHRGRTCILVLAFLEEMLNQALRYKGKIEDSRGTKIEFLFFFLIVFVSFDHMEHIHLLISLQCTAVDFTDK